MSHNIPNAHVLSTITMSTFVVALSHAICPIRILTVKFPSSFLLTFFFLSGRGYLALIMLHFCLYHVSTAHCNRNLVLNNCCISCLSRIIIRGKRNSTFSMILGIGVLGSPFGESHVIHNRRRRWSIVAKRRIGVTQNIAQAIGGHLRCRVW